MIKLVNAYRFYILIPEYVRVKNLPNLI